MSVVLAASHAGNPVGTMLGHLIIVTGSFVLLCILIRLFAWNKVTGILDKRAQHITNQIDKAEEARAEAESLVAQRQTELAQVRKEADGILLEAKQTGEAMKARILAEAEKQADELKEKGRRDIAREREEALAGMKDQVSALALELAQQILLKELDPAAHSELIDRYLDKLGG